MSRVFFGLGLCWLWLGTMAGTAQAESFWSARHTVAAQTNAEVLSLAQKTMVQAAQIPTRTLRPLQGYTPRLGTLYQAHHFEAREPADYVFLYGLLPTIGVAVLVTLTGNIVTLALGKHQATWGGISLVLGAITGLGLLPFFAEEGAAWTLIPLLPAAVLISLGITNLVLGLRKKAEPPAKARGHSPRISLQIIPWLGPGAGDSIQGGMSVLGRF